MLTWGQTIVSQKYVRKWRVYDINMSFYMLQYKVRVIKINFIISLYIKKVFT